ncbi:serine carboxypeptidase S28-domain-containing protein [Sphaerosporella brunnea]|uniref:Serine carboxypeptidase S28-domain-containing protein n=1 Tax=Sphaerosporella brunnea TaxID=1250544 RepID=A0A5J5FCP5_9PEZI|nr:serine carboxypeptidase S28-domain-containing protein [Sphaerosporella brunnea]
MVSFTTSSIAACTAFLLLSILQIVAVTASDLHWHVNHRINHLQKRQEVSKSFSTKTNYIELPLDHFSNASTGTFKNRYWIDDSAYQPGGPVILEDAGESDASRQVSTMPITWAHAIANATDGLHILWEHRYYGASQPSGLSNATFSSVETLGSYYKYLTVENALEDVVSFAAQLKYKNHTLNPGNTPWVFVGGSYPGARAAWLRQRNPEIVYASFASSAVVQAEEKTNYTQAAFEYFKTHGFKGCIDDVQALQAYLNDIFAHNKESEYDSFLKRIYTNNSSPIYKTYIAPYKRAYAHDFRKRMQFTLEGWIRLAIVGNIQYGTTASAQNFCGNLSSIARITDSSKGVFSVLPQSDALEAVAGAFNIILEDALETYENTSIGVFRACVNDNDLASCRAVISSQAFYYQMCSELGFSNRGDWPFIGMEYYNSRCAARFGSAMSSGPTHLPLKMYGGKRKMNPSNTFWEDGEYDPWRLQTPNALDSGRVATDEIPEANKVLDTTGKKVLGIVINDGFHAPILGCPGIVKKGTKGLDLEATLQMNKLDRSCAPNVVKGQQLFLSALEKWLPKFRKHSLGGGEHYL